MQCRLEHANISVLDMDEAIRFLTTALPHFRVRGGSESRDGSTWKKWCHLGTDSIYIAIEQSSTVTEPRGGSETSEARINHVGFVVVDVVAILHRMQSAGYDRHALIEEPPARKRLYVDDASGLTWEFVEYLSADPAIRNDYSI